MMKTLIKNYGMVLVLIALCILFSILTIKEQNPDSDSAANQIVKNIQQSYAQNDIILTVGSLNIDSEPFAVSLKEILEFNGYTNILLVTGIPRDLRLALDSLKLVQKKPVLIATSGDVVKWRILGLFPEFYPELADCEIIVP